MKTNWQAHHERSSPLALKSIRWIALKLGRPAARLLLIPITTYFLIFAPAQRRASLDYLNRILDYKPSWLDVAKHIHCFASTILDRVYLMTGQFDQLDISFPNENMPLKYSKNGIGCILLGSHVGSFEVLRSYAVRKCPLPIKILMYEGQNPMIVEILNALNPELSKMIIPIGSPDSLLEVRDAVESGSAVGMLGDRVMGSENEKTVQCTLLGDQVTLPAAPILVAASLNVPIIVFFGIYQGGNRYQLHFELLGENILLNKKQRQQDIQKWMQKYANLMEKHIHQHPYNWFNFFDYWLDQKIHSDTDIQPSLAKHNITSLIPHSGNMCLIDSVESWNKLQIQCISANHKNADHPLRRDGKLSAIHLLEYGAQAMAIHGGLLHPDTKPIPGYLAAVRNMSLNCERIDDLDSDLLIYATALIKNANGVIYEINITDADQNQLMHARATVINQ